MAKNQKILQAFNKFKKKIFDLKIRQKKILSDLDNRLSEKKISLLRDQIEKM